MITTTAPAPQDAQAFEEGKAICNAFLKRLRAGDCQPFDLQGLASGLTGYQLSGFLGSIQAVLAELMKRPAPQPTPGDARANH